MERPGFIDQNELRNWANTVGARTDFPRLVRRLILETTPGLVQIGMPAGEGVSSGGWDGTIRSTVETAWVPEGLSLWELSVKEGVGTKADGDYRKRLITPDGTPTGDCTYVAGYLRRWNKRADWVKEKSKDGRWKAIKAYGLDDIEHWLETAPVTWAWISERLGLSPYGLRSGETWWENWSSQTTPPTSPGLVLAGQSKQAETLRNTAASPPQITTIGGPSLDEVRAFAAAVAMQAASDGEPQLLARMVFVNELSAWRSLLDSPSPLVLVPLSEELANEVPPACIHHIVVPVAHRETADINLDPIDATEAKQALVEMAVDEKRADESSRLARRSLTALRRNMAVKPALHIPSWAASIATRIERSVLLGGSWSEKLVGDQEVLAELAGVSYEVLRERLTALASEGDPLVIAVGGSWYLVSPFDAWLLLRSSVTQDDLKRLEVLTDQVLGEMDPSLEMAPEDRWKASIEGKVRRHSSDLRRGLAKTLALLGVHGESIDAKGRADGTEWASYLVRKLLDGASADQSGQRWASLSDLLPILAEASPEDFLEAVRQGVTSSDPLLRKLFTDDVQTDVLSSRTFHTGLLWALETTAWAPDHFGASIDLLARLDAIDPGGTYSNRPFNSLVEILCPWHPETSVKSDRRLAGIDALRERHGDCSWRLLLKMLPESHGIHMPTHEPQFRDWKPAFEPILVKDYLEFVAAIVERCIADAGSDLTRWKELLEKLPGLPPKDRNRLLGDLRAKIGSHEISQSMAQELWDPIHEIIGHHRTYADTNWALPEDELAAMESLAQEIAPKNAYDSSKWLFQNHSPSLGDLKRGDDFEAYERDLSSRRTEAVKKIVEEGGMASVRRLARESKVPWAVGAALAETSGRKFETDLLSDFNEEPPSSALELAHGFYSSLFRKEGWSWLDDLVASGPPLTEIAHARLLLAARDFPIAWDKAVDAGAEVSKNYWRNFQPWGLGQGFEFFEIVSRKLISVGRHAAALDLIGMYLGDAGAPGPAVLVPIITDGLRGVLETSGAEREIHLLSSYDFERLFSYLETEKDHVGEETLASLEWAFLPALGFEPDVPTLHNQMASSPSFYLQVLSTVYRPHSGRDEALLEEESKARESLATNGYRLLSSWKNPPGLKNGSLDSAVFSKWLEDVKPLLRDADRYEVGMSHLGQALASVPSDADGSWPSEAVRNMIEQLQDERLESGFRIEVINSRGVTSRDLGEGGDQERTLVEKYRSAADKFADQWPRTAAILRRIAQSYEGDARRNEESAERFRHGLEF